MPESLDIQRKRLLFRSKHRGTKEADLLFGAFAEAYLSGFDKTQLGIYEVLLGAEDPDLWDWVVAQAPVPTEYDTGVMKLLQEFRLPVRPS